MNSAAIVRLQRLLGAASAAEAARLAGVLAQTAACRDHKRRIALTVEQHHPDLLPRNSKGRKARADLNLREKLQAATVREHKLHSDRGTTAARNFRHSEIGLRH